MWWVPSWARNPRVTVTSRTLCLCGVAERHVGRPLLAIIDGSAGLAAALREQWPTLAIQRCTAHKLRNLETKAPVRLREELAEDYRRMIYAETRTLVDQARTRFATTGRNYAAAGAECAQ